MKKAILLYLIFISSALYAGTATVKEQLDKLNKCWLDKHFDDAVLNERIPLNDDVSLIRMHLTLVEKKLREANTQFLSNDQQSKRTLCLDILHSYCERGVFPQNIYHKERTPYFIDHLGTACAVGQLIVSTGYEALAKKISHENNYAYISELNQKYPEIKSWADEYGFSIDELAWIQPGYLSCDTSCSRVASIIVNKGVPPFSYLWNTGATTQMVTGLCIGIFYSCIVLDSLGDTITNKNEDTFIAGSEQTIGDSIMFGNDLPHLSVNITATLDDGSCNGTATAYASGGDGTYTYYWYPSGQHTQTATGLCAGTYRLSINSAGSMDCEIYDSVEVNLITSSSMHQQGSGFMIYPNPASNTITITGVIANGAKQSPVTMIYNMMGEKVYESEIRNNGIASPSVPAGPSFTMTVDCGEWAKGVYLVLMNTEGKTARSKLIIQ